MLRRTFMKALGAAPFVAPKVASEVHHVIHAGAGAGQLGLTKAYGLSERALSDANPPQQENPILQKARLSWIRNQPGYLEELRDAIRREVHVTYIDPDLMAMKSLSQAARIYYMRQRMIEARVRIEFEDGSDDPCSSIWKVTHRWLDMAYKAVL